MTNTGGCVMQRGKKYAEFNSDVLTPNFSRRIRLYQAMAVVNTRRVWEDVTEGQLKEWITTFKIEASHLCRYIITDTVINPDGSYTTIYIVRENKACFAPDHVILEEAKCNGSRIGCKGGESCTHHPACIVVPAPGEGEVQPMVE